MHMGKLKWSALEHSLKTRIRKKKWEEGAAAQAYEKRNSTEINCCGSGSIHDIYQKFYYCSLNPLLIPKPSTIREYADVYFSEPERLLRTTRYFLSATQSNKPKSLLQSAEIFKSQQTWSI